MPPKRWQLLVFLPTRAWGEGPDDSPTASDEQLETWIDAVDAEDRKQFTRQPLAPADHHMGRAEFCLPPVTLESLPAGHDVVFAVACCRHPGLGLDQQRIAKPGSTTERSVQRFRESQLPGGGLANSTRGAVFTAETIDLGDGQVPRMQVPQGGEFEPGSGLGFIQRATAARACRDQLLAQAVGVGAGPDERLRL